MTTKREQAIRLKDIGLTQVDIGKVLGISSERVRQMINGKNYKKVALPLVELPLSTGDVARMLNIHTNTVRRWCRSGVLKAYRVGPRKDRRFRLADVVNLMRDTEP